MNFAQRFTIIFALSSLSLPAFACNVDAVPLCESAMKAGGEEGKTFSAILKRIGVNSCSQLKTTKSKKLQRVKSSEDSASTFADVRCYTLPHLSLSASGIRSLEPLKAFALSGHLDLSGNNISDEDLFPLLKVGETTLEKVASIDLSNNKLKDTSHLVESELTRKMKLDGNNFSTPEDLIGIAASLKENVSSHGVAWDMALEKTSAFFTAFEAKIARPVHKYDDLLPHFAPHLAEFLSRNNVTRAGSIVELKKWLSDKKQIRIKPDYSSFSFESTPEKHSVVQLKVQLTWKMDIKGLKKTKLKYGSNDGTRSTLIMAPEQRMNVRYLIEFDSDFKISSLRQTVVPEKLLIMDDLQASESIDDVLCPEINSFLSERGKEKIERVWANCKNLAAAAPSKTQLEKGTIVEGQSSYIAIDLQSTVCTDRDRRGNRSCNTERIERTIREVARDGKTLWIDSDSTSYEVRAAEKIHFAASVGNPCGLTGPLNSRIEECIAKNRIADGYTSDPNTPVAKLVSSDGDGFWVLKNKSDALESNMISDAGKGCEIFPKPASEERAKVLQQFLKDFEWKTSDTHTGDSAVEKDKEDDKLNQIARRRCISNGQLKANAASMK
ncbi:hypothetical protein EBU99_08435 [bacterium]|nr:hypothetical protein [bacterium]